MMDFTDDFNNSKSRPKLASKRKIIGLILILIILAGLATGGWWAYHKPKPAAKSYFPANISSNLAFPVYYPASFGGGYSYQTGSAKTHAGILFYAVSSGKKRILVTEQAAPSDGINLSSLPAHSPLSVPIGNAVIGTGLGKPSAVIMAPSTLIQLTSTGGVTKADIINVARAMSQWN